MSRVNNALAKTIDGLYKAGLIRRWASGFNPHELLEPI
jgi:hypothetical protein